MEQTSFYFAASLYSKWDSEIYRAHNSAAHADRTFLRGHWGENSTATSTKLSHFVRVAGITIAMRGWGWECPATPSTCYQTEWRVLSCFWKVLASTKALALAEVDKCFRTTKLLASTIISPLNSTHIFRKNRSINQPFQTKVFSYATCCEEHLKFCARFLHSWWKFMRYIFQIFFLGDESHIQR